MKMCALRARRRRYRARLRESFERIHEPRKLRHDPCRSARLMARPPATRAIDRRSSDARVRRSHGAKKWGKSAALLPSGRLTSPVGQLAFRGGQAAARERATLAEGSRTVFHRYRTRTPLRGKPQPRWTASSRRRAGDREVHALGSNTICLKPCSRATSRSQASNELCTRPGAASNASRHGLASGWTASLWQEIKRITGWRDDGVRRAGGSDDWRRSRSASRALDVQARACWRSPIRAR